MRRLALLCSVLLLLGVSGCATLSADLAVESAAGGPAVAPAAGSAAGAGAGAAAGAAEEVTFTVLGDSNTAGNLGSLEDGLAAGASWAHFADLQPGLRLLGGFAHNGYTLPQIAAEARPSDARFLIVMAGTNDLSRALPRGESLAALDAAVQSVGAEEVVVVAVPPRSDRALQTLSLNSWLISVAEERGWRSFDPWGWTRAGDGSWSRPGCAADVLHATVAGYERAGLSIARQLVEWAERPYLGAPAEVVIC